MAFKRPYLTPIVKVGTFVDIQGPNLNVCAGGYANKGFTT